MRLTIFSSLTEAQKEESVESLIEGSTPRQDFFLLAILAVAMATLGIAVDSIAVIIGSVLVAPMLYPVLSLSLGIVMSDVKLIGRALYTIIRAVLFSVIAAAIVALLLPNSQYIVIGNIIEQTSPSLLYVAIAVIAGFAASFATVKPGLNESFPGVAISVALILPLAVTGIAIASFDFELARGAILTFCANASGIVFATLIVFSLMSFHGKRKVARQTVVQEKQKIKQEEKRAEKQASQ